MSLLLDRELAPAAPGGACGSRPPMRVHVGDAVFAERL